MKPEVKSKPLNWAIEFTGSADKQRAKLPDKIRALVDALAGEMELSGPIRKNWKNFSKLAGDDYHCHLKKGRPTYVACWRIIDKKDQIIEVYYVGTHENAPY
jgi:hypothetical protein